MIKIDLCAHPQTADARQTLFLTIKTEAALQRAAVKSVQAKVFRGKDVRAAAVDRSKPMCS